VHFARVDLEHRRLRAVLDALPTGVLVADGQGASCTSRPGRPSHARRAAHAASTDDYAAVYQAWWTESGVPLAPHEWGLARALREGVASTAS
jgi:hypothetical protein